MDYLIDTHILIWAVANTKKLSKAARKVLSDSDSRCFFSSVSIWEIAIKHARHPEEMPISAADAIQLFLSAGFQEIDPVANECAMLEDLPPHHLDPFDRLLVAQALHRDMKLITHDHIIPLYGDNVIKV